jgi:hypothetical protein
VALQSLEHGRKPLSESHQPSAISENWPAAAVS